MNTVFTKTLLWFFGTVLLTVAALMVGTAVSSSNAERRQGPFGALIRYQFAEARHAYEARGVEGLAAMLRRVEEVTDTQGILTDKNGRDLVSGEDRSDLVRAVRERSRMPFLRRDRTVIGRQSDDGAYFYFILLNRGSAVAWFLQPEVHVGILVVLALFCYGFARYLTNPVRRLQRAVDCFGRGDFSARARITRGDEIGQLGRAFNDMADRIQTLLDAERRLLLDISHELRSPLARLSVAVELARAGEDLDSHLNRIQKEADRLNALVGQLLQVTRAEGDASALGSQQIALDDLVADVVADARIEAAARHCDVALHTEPITVTGDPELLRRAVENIVRNGIRYAPERTSLEVALRKRRDRGVIEVRDLGPGVPEESLGRIFDPFYRVNADRDRASGGVGLGLSIARRAIELHHGTVTAQNAGPGLLVEIELPLPVQA